MVSGGVHEVEDADVARVCREKEVVCYFKEGCLSAVLRAETRLEHFIQIFGGEVDLELGGNGTFQYFREQGEVGDGTEV